MICNSFFEKFHPENLSPGVEDLELDNFISIKSILKQIPHTVKVLRLFDCDLTDLNGSDIPDNISHLKMVKCEIPNNVVYNLPTNLKVLQIFYTDVELAFYTLPYTLEKLELHYVTSLVYIHYLPMYLSSLTVCDCPLLKYINIPSRVHTLNLRDCESLTSLPTYIFKDLLNLSVSNCSFIEKIEFDLLENLKSLRIFHNSIKEISLHDNLEVLRLGHMGSFVELPENLPSELKSLKLFDIPLLKKLPAILPNTLKYLYLNCEALEGLPKNMPNNLHSLNIDNCKSLKHFSTHLHENLLHLEITRCNKLETIESLIPWSLTTLFINHCNKLKGKIHCDGGLIISEVETQYSVYRWSKRGDCIYCAGCFNGNYKEAIKRAGDRQDYLDAIEDIHGKILCCYNDFYG